MSLYALDDTLWFPPVEEAMSDGLLAIGGDVSPERLLLAYRRGIFPWYEGETPLWWCPDPRFVLFPEKLKIHKSMRSLLHHPPFRFSVNTAFDKVVQSCAQTPRAGQDGTWITADLYQGLLQLHAQGYAHSAEAWMGDLLIGGLYGVRMGKLFFGESMFSTVSNASKFAFIRYVQLLMEEGLYMIDCQVHTPHLESLGAEMIPRKTFMEILEYYGEAVR